MSAKRNDSDHTSPILTDPPEITDEWLAGADLHHGKRLVRSGRPKLAHPRKLLSLRLPPEIISSWKATGPGWQTRMAKILERSAPKPRRSAGK